MSTEQFQKFETPTITESTKQSESTLGSFSLADIQATLKDNSNLGTIFPNLQFRESDLQFCKADRPAETKEQRLDRQIKECFPSDILDHLKDHDWLIDHKKELREGFDKAKALGGNEAWDMAWRMRELSMVDGKPFIKMCKQESKSAGTIIPKRWDIYLKRNWVSDDHLGHIDH